MPNTAVTVTPTFTDIFSVNGGLYMNMPFSGTINATIPDGVKSFKLYDDGGIADIDSWGYLERRKHNPSNWKYNEEGHWKECAYENCGIVIEIISDHKYDNHVDINCNICGYVRNITFTGWQYINGKWYHLNNDGVMNTGWLQSGSTKYYLNTSGEMLIGWQHIGSSWYYFQSGGNMVTGWLKFGNTWYYFNNSGVMSTGWQQVGGNWYYLESSGVMVANRWVGNYYLQLDGTMARNKWIGKYYVGADGCWVA